MARSFDEYLAVLSPTTVEEMMRTTGLDLPILFYQFLYIQAWYAQKRLIRMFGLRSDHVPTHRWPGWDLAVSIN